ncbi:SCP2 sterol-binding domain-containing protein [Dictyobacter formicarum]|uniref:4Fe-4S ferredoxin n=1 Tax=Dictyobacter formicarum TaxID=2778368 RepID=A0ABQ3VGT0_9CHLR|nr:SCP2 sterol-binding domain-containing protein [Dictyobacter formicarum]GHO85370.1 4Fe-4S ferredoxin [Dictyobacter formicarum]
MASLSEHPTVQAFQARQPHERPPTSVDQHWLRNLCLESGADDVGFVEIERPELENERSHILAALPHTRTLISLVRRMNRENIRTPARSVANVEFHHSSHDLEDVARKIVAALEQKNIRAICPAVGFPQEMDRYPGRIWVVAHKPVAVAAGMGRMGIHRNVIHPRFGNFILLETILMEATIDSYSQPIDYNPCLECKLCVAACPVGAIGSDGHFDFSACMTHNYREFMGGFTDWVEKVADSKDAAEYREKVTPAESASMWQSLSFKANYKAAYCMAVCPAGEDVIGPFLENRKTYLQDVVKPLQNKEEIIYVTPGSDAEEHVKRRFPHKTIRHAHNGLRTPSIHSFLNGLPLVFQREKAADMDVAYHFTFTGQEKQEATIIIRHKTLLIQKGLTGEANLSIKVDSATWLKILNKKQNIILAILRRKLQLRGSPQLLQAFQRCFAT